MPTKPTIPSVWASDPSAVIATPPSALQLLGWAVGEQPTAANVNWKFNEIDQWITFVDPYIGSTDGDLFANSIRPYSDNTLLDGLYLYDGGSGYTVVLKSYSGKGQVRSAFNVGNTSSTDELINGTTGTVTWTNLNGVDWGPTAVQTYMLVGLTAATKLRYGYAATKPTFVWDMSPICGGYTVTNPNTVLFLDTPSNGIASLTITASNGTVKARRPLLFPHDTARTTETVYELVSMTARLDNQNATAAVVRFVARNRSTWASTVISQINRTIPNSMATVTDTISPPAVLDPSAYSYYVELETTGAIHNSGEAYFQQVLLNVRKSAVE